jgi:ATP:ADP antiporter, AAA family
VKRPRVVARLVDLRPGESQTTIVSFVVLALTSAAYTALETARDALLVTWLPRRHFGFVYIALAACALPAAALLARVARRWDPRRVLAVLLLLSATTVLVYVALPIRQIVVVAFYVTAGLIASAVFPQFWVLVGTALTVGQNRRLIGPIGSAAVVGSVVGASAAAATMASLSVHGLIAVSAATLAVAGVATFFVPRLPTPRMPPTSRGSTPALATSMSAFRDEPLLVRVAILVALTTATALVIDYFFKSTIARTIPSASRGTFIARYYAVVNVVALVVQLFLGAALVRGFGVANSIVVTPLFSAFGGTAALVGNAFAMPVLVLKAADASLRSSINRLTTELVYLPVSSSGRERAKPFIDGALVRIVQALTAGALLGLGSAHLLKPLVFSAIIVVLSFLWLVAAVTMRPHYLGQLRRSVVPLLDDDRRALELDLPSAELLVEHLGSDDPLAVLAAMNTLERRGRQRLIPALVLRHPDERVLRRALEIFASGPQSRSDWHTLARRLLEHENERVRIAAAGALAAHGKLDFDRLASDSSPGVRGYASLHAALLGPHVNLVDDPRIAAVLQGDSATLTGLLVAVAVAEPSPRISSVLLKLADLPNAPDSPAWTNLLARATVQHREPAMIPRLVAQLPRWESRETIRGALVSLGEPAFVQVAKAFDDVTNVRRLRVQLPQTLGRFGTPEAAEKLLDHVEHEPDGLVRYKALRALGRLVADDRIGVDRRRVAHCIRANFVGYFTLLGVRVALGASPVMPSGRQSSAFRLLAGLLEDKLRQSIERAFRLLKIVHSKEDIHRVYLACIGSDKRARANAAEFMDALLWRREERPLRVLVRIVSDDLSREAAVDLAAAHLGLIPPRTHQEAVQAALADADIKVAALAAMYAVATGADGLIASVHKAQERRPSLAPAARGIFQDPFAARPVPT